MKKPWARSQPASEQLQARVARPEIVEGDAEALTAVRGEDAVEAVPAAGFVELGELEDDARRGESRLCGDDEGIARRVIGHLEEAVVDIVEELGPARERLREFREGFSPEREIDGVEQPLLEGGIEDIGYGMEPRLLAAAQECLVAVGGSVGEGGDGLEGEIESREGEDPRPGHVVQHADHLMSSMRAKISSRPSRRRT
jgi:hypothetical protein